MFSPEYSCDDFMMLWLFTYIVCAKVFNEFSRKLCPFHCWQKNIKKRECDGMDRIVSYCIEGTDKNLFDGIHYIYIHIKKNPKTRIRCFFSLYQNVNIWQTWSLLNDLIVYILCVTFETSSPIEQKI